LTEECVLFALVKSTLLLNRGRSAADSSERELDDKGGEERKEGKEGKERKERRARQTSVIADCIDLGNR
jgi:hypothetical protein